MYQLQALGRYTPVAVLVARDDTVSHMVCDHVAEPALHGREIAADWLGVAVLAVEHVGHGKPCGRPCDIVGKAVPVVGRDIGDTAVDFLCGAYVVEPFVVEKMVATQVCLA